MKIILTGPTGMVGSEVLRQALLDEQITEITALSRKPLPAAPKLKTIILTDFMNYAGLEEVFRTHDACMWCLGISQNAVNEQEYITITYDYTIAAAEAMLKANPGITLLFLSGEGAKTDEKSRYLFGRIKGRTEKALSDMPFKRLLIARPAGIIPVDGGSRYPFALRLQYLFARIMKYITPAYVITSVKLAKAMLYILKYGNNATYSFTDINAAAQRIEA